MKYYRVELGGVDNWIWSYKGDFADHHKQWTQQPDHWSMFFLEHSGVFFMNNQAYPFEDGYVALAGPGAKIGFLNVGDGTPHYALTFAIKKRIETVAVPSIADLGEFKELRRKEFKRANEWLTKSIGPSIAVAYSILWEIAQPANVLRSSSFLYEFERAVTERLAEKISVAELCRELKVSQSQLLRLVRAEHGQTIQEFIREKRAEIAKTLIVTTNLPLKTIAAQTGMPDLQYFNKAVRASFGLSPRALRELSVNRTPH
jgi:AraC-like DNA-binding protein